MQKIVCTLLQRDNPVPHHSVFTGRMPFLPPNQQRQITEGMAQLLSWYSGFCELKISRDFLCKCRTYFVSPAWWRFQLLSVKHRTHYQLHSTRQSLPRIRDTRSTVSTAKINRSKLTHQQRQRHVKHVTQQHVKHVTLLSRSSCFCKTLRSDK